MDLIDIFMTFYSNAEEYVFCSFAMEHSPGQTTSNIFSNHKAMRLHVNYKKENCKKHKHMEMNQLISK